MVVSSAWGGSTHKKHNYASLLWSRIFQGVALAPFEALVNACVGDLYFVHERGVRMAITNTCLFGGAFLTPVFVGMIAANMGWQWSVSNLYWLWAIIRLTRAFSFTFLRFSWPWDSSWCCSLCQRRRIAETIPWNWTFLPMTLVTPFTRHRFPVKRHSRRRQLKRLRLQRRLFHQKQPSPRDSCLSTGVRQTRTSSSCFSDPFHYFYTRRLFGHACFRVSSSGGPSWLESFSH